MSDKLTRSDLMSLESYAEARKEFRAKVIEHKKNRTVHLGQNATLYFEDRLTVQYQVQEMLRIEKIFEADGIKEELEAYNPLIPDGSNWKATFMIEYPDVDERKKMLGQLIGIERQVWVQIDDCDKVYPIANEDLDRETDEKTSSVHFLRFEFTPGMIEKARTGAAIAIGVDHNAYSTVVKPLPENYRNALVADFD
ncbi:MAG: DUF3501 family protein [Gammaproteobacteria bacterium]|nr:DUF3501 family protein [Gammaproteobacteria bacterium]